MEAGQTLAKLSKVSLHTKLAWVYGIVVVIWSTTPLAIKLSVDSVDFIQAVALRMWFSLLLCAVLLKCFAIPFSVSRYAMYVYVAGAVSVCGAMLCVYFAAQYLASGVIATVWGLAPIVVSFYAFLLLPNQKISVVNLLCLLLGVAGLYVIFAHDMVMAGGGLFSLLILLIGVNLHSASSVLLQKRPHTNDGQHEVLHPLVETTGSLALSAPVYVVLWWNFSGPLPESISFRFLFSISYLSVFGSVIGFVGYFYLLTHMSAASVSLVTLITPVLALFLGSAFAGESLTLNTAFGCGLIMGALALYQRRVLCLFRHKVTERFFVKST